MLTRLAVDRRFRGPDKHDKIMTILFSQFRIALKTTVRVKDQKIVENCGIIAERVLEWILIDYWSGFCGICGMEIGNEIFCMFKFIGGKPREFLVGIFITKPSD